MTRISESTTGQGRAETPDRRAGLGAFVDVDCQAGRQAKARLRAARARAQAVRVTVAASADTTAALIPRLTKQPMSSGIITGI